MGCPFCDQDMNTAESCTKNVILYPRRETSTGGYWHFAIPFGEEERGIIDGVDIEGERCNDCGVMEGGYHHPGCDIEESPSSGDQLLREIISAPDGEAPYHARAQGDPLEGIEIQVLR